MPSLFDKLFGKSDKSTRAVAKDRLRFVITHDRADISPTMLEQIRSDVMSVLSRYLDIDEQALEVSLERVEGEVALVANIPIRRVRTEGI